MQKLAPKISTLAESGDNTLQEAAAFPQISSMQLWRVFKLSSPGHGSESTITNPSQSRVSVIM